MNNSNHSFGSTRFFVGGFLFTVLLVYAFIKWVDPLGLTRQDRISNPALSAHDADIDLEAEDLLALTEVKANKKSTNPVSALGENRKGEKAKNVSSENNFNKRQVSEDLIEKSHFDAVSARWFQTENTVQLRTGFGLESKYAPPAPLLVKVSPECPRGVKIKLKKEFSQSVKELLGVTGESKFPKDAPIDKFTLFWKKGSEHYQVNAIWQMNDPPTYLLEKWKAADSKMEKEAEEITLGEGQKEEVQWASAEKYLQSELQKAIEDGAEEGARIFTTSIGSNQAVFLNSTPIQLLGEQFECKVTNSGSGSERGIASCECP